ncbi:MAG: T9SS type A sorting domain-containing protein [Flavobacteriales bacterium]|nr:T9SS type A sorting domain-containing protein [Flavobacteriales bacterium]
MYRSVLSAGLMALALHVGAQSTVNQVVVLNEGYYDYFNGQGQLVPVTLGSYDPTTGIYQTVATITGPRFGSDVLVDGGDIYVAADDRVLRFDADTYQQTGEAMVQGARKLAVWNGQLLITRGELGGLPHYFEVRDRNTLDLQYTITPADGLQFAAEDVLVVGDKAYLAVGNAFEWGNFVGRVGVVDLLTGTYGAEVDLGPEGTNPEKLMEHEGDIIAFNNTDFSHSSISRVNVSSGTIAYTTNVSANSSCAASAKVGANGRVYYMEYAQNELARFDLNNGVVADTLAGSPAVYGLIEDPVNGVLYATTTDFFSTGDLHVMDLEGNVLSTVAVGVSPGNLAMDIRLSTSVSSQQRPVLGLYPNPASETVALSGVLQGAQIRVFDSMGRVVLERASVNVEGIVQLDIAALQNGVYTVQVQGQGTLRFTKG